MYLLSINTLLWSVTILKFILTVENYIVSYYTNAQFLRQYVRFFLGSAVHKSDRPDGIVFLKTVHAICVHINVRISNVLYDNMQFLLCTYTHGKFVADDDDLLASDGCTRRLFFCTPYTLTACFAHCARMSHSDTHTPRALGKLFITRDPQ